MLLIGVVNKDAILVKDELNELDVAFLTGKNQRGFALFCLLTINIGASIKEVVYDLNRLRQLACVAAFDCGLKC